MAAHGYLVNMKQTVNVASVIGRGCARGGAGRGGVLCRGSAWQPLQLAHRQNSRPQASSSAY